VAEVGDKLIEAKSLVEHGEWEPWIEKNLKFGVRQAQKHICIYKYREGIEWVKANSEFAFESLSKALDIAEKPLAFDIAPAAER
jgi:hypothetical protein